jgi:hypothetical protein
MRAALSRRCDRLKSVAYSSAVIPPVQSQACAGYRRSSASDRRMPNRLNFLFAQVTNSPFRIGNAVGTQQQDYRSLCLKLRLIFSETCPMNQILDNRIEAVTMCRERILVHAYLFAKRRSRDHPTLG